MARALRGAISRRAIIVIVVIAGGLVVLVPGCLIALLMPAAHIAVQAARRASCRYNLMQIGQACRAYAAAHKERWPDAFPPYVDRWDDVGGTRTDQWGTGPGGGPPPRAEAGDAEGAAVESNTASLWMLVAAGYLTPACLVCPGAADHLRDETVTQYEEVRDFRGDRFCSYSYQNVLGPYGLSEAATDRPADLAIAADASPLRRDWRTGAGTPGKTDARMARKPTWPRSDAHPSWRGPLAGPWELNSPNHKFAGQNVLYLDGHVVWVDTPYCGVNCDNIWLLRVPGAEAPGKDADLEAVRRTNDTASYDGKSALPPGHGDDSFLVP